MAQIVVIALAVVFAMAGLGVLSVRKTAFGYPDMRHTLSSAEWSRAQAAHSAEAHEFLQQVKGKNVGQWTLGEHAAYESIRRREAIYGF